MIMKKIVLIYILLLSYSNLFSQINWPFPNSTQQANVIGSVGEYRYSSISQEHRFHKGIDITNGTEYSIHALNSGNITYAATGSATDSYVRVGTVYYWHVEPKQLIIDGTVTSANTGDYLGEIMTNTSGPHLHLQEANTNYLNNTLSPYIDSSTPTFATNYIDNGVAFYQNGLLATTTNHANLLLTEQVNLNGTNYKILYNKVDIVAHIIDQRTNSNGTGGGGQMAPYNISYDVKDVNDVSLYSDEINFNAAPDNAGAEAAFHPQSGHPGNPSIHIITSSPYQTPFDRYWNTNLKETQTETWINNTTLDANCIDDALIPDGKYTIEINAYDVDFNDNPNRNAQSKTIDIVIDNFQPYVKKVEVRIGDENGELAYLAEWEWNGTALVFNRQLGATIYDDDDIWLKAYTSEPMKRLRFSAFGYYGNEFPGTSENNGKEWIFEIPGEKTPTNSFPMYYTYPSETGSTDLAGNRLFGFRPDDGTEVLESDIPKHQNDGTWIPALRTESDFVHFFKIEKNVAGVPSNIQATTDDPNKVVVTWNPVGTDGYYRVYRGASLTPISNWITETSFEDYNINPGASDTYKVQASRYSDGNNPSEYSNAVTGTRPSGLIANFNYLQTNFTFSDFDVQFTNNSVSSNSNIESYYWNFGDGNNSTEQSPLHTYYSKGTYTVSLKITDENGNIDTYYNYDVSVTEDYEESITVDAYWIYNGNNDYTFYVTVWDNNLSRTHDLLLNFGDGGSNSITSGGSVSHSYSVPMTTITYYPYVIVTAHESGYSDKDFIYQIDPITIEQSYTLNVSISRNTNHVYPGGECSFTATVSGGIGNYNYSWIINKNPNDLSGLCNPDNGSDPNCLRVGNTRNTPEFTFSEEGNYKIYIVAWEGLRTGSAEYYLTVGEAEDPCVDIDIEDNGGTQIFEVAIGSRIAITAVGGSYGCGNLYPPTDDIGKIEWKYDDRIIKTKQWDSYNDLYYMDNNDLCLSEEMNNTLIEEGEHTLRVKAWGASISPIGDLTLNYSPEKYSTVSKIIKVVDCNSSVTIEDDFTLILLHVEDREIQRGTINIVPKWKIYNWDGKIEIESGESIVLKAFDKIVMKPGLHIKQGASFSAQIKECPLIQETCIEYKADNQEIKTVSGKEPEIKLNGGMVISANLYPNPTNSNFTIEISGDPSMVQSIEIYNVQGQLILLKDEQIECYNDFDLSIYPQGIYFIMINNFENQIVKKLIKE